MNIGRIEAATLPDEPPARVVDLYYTFEVQARMVQFRASGNVERLARIKQRSIRDAVIAVGNLARNPECIGAVVVRLEDEKIILGWNESVDIFV